jgi:hypothetical protein
MELQSDVRQGDQFEEGAGIAQERDGERLKGVFLRSESAQAKAEAR